MTGFDGTYHRGESGFATRLPPHTEGTMAIDRTVFRVEVPYSDLQILRLEVREYPRDVFKVHIRTWYRYTYDGDFKPGKGCTFHLETWPDFLKATKAFTKLLRKYNDQIRGDE